LAAIISVIIGCADSNSRRSSASSQNVRAGDRRRIGLFTPNLPICIGRKTKKGTIAVTAIAPLNFLLRSVQALVPEPAAYELN
jgi:hypothetical protein